jgi:hypothetical protein
MEKYRKDVLYKLDRNEVKLDRNYSSHLNTLFGIIAGTIVGIGNYILTGGDADSSVSMGIMTSIGSKASLEAVNGWDVNKKIRELDEEYYGE